MLGNLAPEDVSQRGADRYRDIKYSQRLVATLSAKTIGNQAWTDRRVARLAKSNQNAVAKQRAITVRGACQYSTQAPDKNAGSNEPLSRKTVAQITEYG